MSPPRLVFVVSGPRRDYDVAHFCHAHAEDAVKFAVDWLTEIMDLIDEDEQSEITVAFRAGLERCYECNPMTKEEIAEAEA